MFILKRRLELLSRALLVPFMVLATPTMAATRSIEQHQSADPAGTVEIINVAGSVAVVGWDKPEVAVTGDIGERVERVDITGSDKHLTVRVVLPIGGHWSGDGAANLTVHVPQQSSLTLSLVSADLKVGGVSGSQQIHTVSGKVVSDGGGLTRINTISGDVQISLPSGTPADISTVSGHVVVRGGEGEVSVKSVSGDGQLTLGTLTNFHLETVSGNFSISARLASGSRFEASAVSGDLQADFAGVSGASYELSTLSGEISNCTEQKAISPRYGPGSHLSFTTGDGKASVELSSKSGNLRLCSK
jgi:hypothetical protein